MAELVITTRGNAIAQKRLEERKRVFGDCEGEVWHRADKGFVSIPRILPLILLLIRQQTQQVEGKTKGNASRVYLDLWARTFDAGFLKLNDEEAAAYSAGYLGERGLRTWREHMKDLNKNGFIEVRASGNKSFAYVLLINPFLVVARMLARKELTDSAWIGAFISRCSEIGAVIPPALEVELQKRHSDA